MLSGSANRVLFVDRGNPLGTNPDGLTQLFVVDSDGANLRQLTSVNDARMAEVVRRCAAQVAGSELVVVPDLTMGGEDMSFFLLRAPGCYYCIGVGREGAAPLHYPKFDFKEDLMLLGVKIHCRVALDLLSRKAYI